MFYSTLGIKAVKMLEMGKEFGTASSNWEKGLKREIWRGLKNTRKRGHSRMFTISICETMGRKYRG